MVYLEPLQIYKTRKQAERDIIRYRAAGTRNPNSKYKRGSFIIKQTFSGEYTLYFKETREFNDAYHARPKAKNSRNRFGKMFRD